MNQAFVAIFVVAVCIAILLWSAEIWLSRLFSRGLAGYGAIFSLAVLAALLSGHLPMDVHGVGLGNRSGF